MPGSNKEIRKKNVKGSEKGKTMAAGEVRMCPIEFGPVLRGERERRIHHRQGHTVNGPAPKLSTKEGFRENERALRMANRKCGLSSNISE